MRYFKIPLRDNKPNRDYGLKTTFKIRRDKKKGLRKE